MGNLKVPLNKGGIFMQLLRFGVDCIATSSGIGHTEVAKTHSRIMTRYAAKVAAFLVKIIMTIMTKNVVELVSKGAVEEAVLAG